MIFMICVLNFFFGSEKKFIVELFAQFEEEYKVSVCLKYSFGHTKKISTTNIVFLTCPLGLLKKNLFWSGCNMIWSSVVSSSHTYIPHSGPNPIKALRLISTSFIFFVTNQSGDCRVLSAKILQFLAHCSPLAFYSIENLFVWKKNCALYLSHITSNF